MNRLPFTPTEFDAVRSIAMRIGRMSAERIDDVRLVLLDGLTCKEAAERRQISAQAVWKSVSRFSEFRESYRLAQVAEKTSQPPAKVDVLKKTGGPRQAAGNLVVAIRQKPNAR